MKRILSAAASVLLSAAIVLPSLHVALRPSNAAQEALGGELLSAQVGEWDRGQRDVDRAVNPEWDLGHHTFFALALANVALDPATDRVESERHRTRVDAVLAELRARPAQHFHMAYFRGRQFKSGESRSLFLDGELLMILAARLTAWPDPTRHAELDTLGRQVVEEMSKTPMLMGESYPDECWMFDNTLALAALRLGGHALGRPIAGAEELTRRWRANVPRFTDPHTGLLVSSTTWEGATLDGPEGSSAFGVAHFLELVDRDLAKDQYERAREHLVVRPLGFAYAHEWPDKARWGKDPLPPRAGLADVDSGPVVPFFGAGAGASGMAILGAAAFHDDTLVRELVTSLELAAFPERDGGKLRYLASNGLGDAVMLYAMTQGPLWRAAQGEAPRGRGTT